MHTLPFPENATEADDKEDFLYGLPVAENEEAGNASISSEDESDAFSAQKTPEDEIDIDALLNSNIDDSIDESNVVQETDSVQEGQESISSELPDFGDLPDINENPVIESFTETSDETVSSDDNFDMMGFDAVDNVNPDENVDVVSDDFSMPEFGSSSSSPDLPDLNDTSFDLPDFDFGEPSSTQEDSSFDEKFNFI